MTQRPVILRPEARPQDPDMDGTGLTFKTLEHGGSEPDTMPQAIKLIDAEGRYCLYVPMKTSDGEIIREWTPGIWAVK